MAVTIIDSQVVEFDDVLPGFSGIAAGDFALAACYHLSTVPSTPSGWSVLTTGVTGAGENLRVFYKFLTGSEPGSYEFTNAIHVIGVAARGTHASSAYDGFVSDGLRDDLGFTEYDIPAITTAGVSRVLIALMVHSSRPFGEGEETINDEVSVEDYTHVESGPNNYQQIYQLAAPTAGVYGPKTVVLELTARFFIAVVVALRPTVDAPDPDPGTRFDCSAIDSQIN
jgi:hypothetical protein